MKSLKALLFLFIGTLIPLGAEEPLVIYLTWTQDPTTTMTVQWQSTTGKGLPQLVYHASGEVGWKSIKGQTQMLKNTDVDVHRIQLEGLKADSEYVFKIQDSKKEYRFRTMPKKLSRPLRIAIGGDAYYTSGTEVFQRMNKMIGKSKPDFVVVGGDLAYTTGTKHLFKGRNWEADRWQTFLRDLQGSLGADGLLVPILPIVGNHDVNKPKNKSARPEMFYEIFTFPEAEKAYRSLDFGDYLSLVMLDTNHTWPIEGDQTAWLEKTLKKSSATYVLAAYHVAAYPSYYPYDGEKEEKIRKNWVPLFEKYEVPFAFEHHNHTYKRTHPLKEGKVDSSGVTYLGDGSWGVPPRPAETLQQLWYLAQSASINSCYMVTLTEEKCLIEAKNLEGKVIDQVEKVLEAVLKP